MVVKLWFDCIVDGVVGYFIKLGKIVVRVIFNVIVIDVVVYCYFLWW